MPQDCFWKFLHALAHHVIFITEFVLLIKTPPFYEVNSFNRKWLAHGGISKIFFLLFTNIFSTFHKHFFTFHKHFRPKIVFLDTDSILRVKTMYDSVK